MSFRLWLAHVADKFDDLVLKHRFYWVCTFIVDRLWPDTAEECDCDWCAPARAELEDEDGDAN